MLEDQKCSKCELIDLQLPQQVFLLLTVDEILFSEGKKNLRTQKLVNLNMILA